MIYGNHNKKKGDIVKIARWDGREMNLLKTRLGTSCKDPGELTFMIVLIDYSTRDIFLQKKGLNWAVRLDETNLIKVGQIY